jgi:hypothetical protein
MLLPRLPAKYLGYGAWGAGAGAMLFNNIEQRGVTELAAVAGAAARAADAMSSDQIGCVFECGPKLLRGHPPIRSPAPGEEISR